MKFGFIHFHYWKLSWLWWFLLNLTEIFSNEYRYEYEEGRKFQSSWAWAWGCYKSRKQFRNRSAVSPQKQYVLSAAMPTLFAGLWQCQCSDFDFIRMKRNIQWISICSILASSTSSVTAGSGSDGVEMSDDTVKIFDFNTGTDEVNNWWEVSDTVR